MNTDDVLKSLYFDPILTTFTLLMMWIGHIIWILGTIGTMMVYDDITVKNLIWTM